MLFCRPWSTPRRPGPVAFWSRPGPRSQGMWEEIHGGRYKMWMQEREGGCGRVTAWFTNLLLMHQDLKLWKTIQTTTFAPMRGDSSSTGLKRRRLDIVIKNTQSNWLKLAFEEPQVSYAICTVCWKSLNWRNALFFRGRLPMLYW